jgi:hypothetical protein
LTGPFSLERTHAYCGCNGVSNGCKNDAVQTDSGPTKHVLPFHCVRVLVPLEHLDDKRICHFCRFGKSYKSLGDEDVIGCRCTDASCTVAWHRGKACTGVFLLPAVKSVHGTKSFRKALTVKDAYISAFVERNGAEKFGLCHGCAGFPSQEAYYGDTFASSKRLRRCKKEGEMVPLAGEGAGEGAGAGAGAGEGE